MADPEVDEVLNYRFRGLGVATVIIAAWLFFVGLGLFGVTIHQQPIVLLLPHVVLIAFLYTGLFITAHDAMHRTLLPRDPVWNDLIGRVAVLLFAMFSYPMLRTKHHEHHAQPGTGGDPDYHDGAHPGYVAWYLHFMREYVSWTQIAGMSCMFVLLWLAGAPPQNILLFWALPAILSTFQLFTFGTYLPHREPQGGYTNRHRATSSGYSRWASFLSCYHFGYHFEHHEWPFIPWWKLGSRRGRPHREQPIR